MKEEFLHFIWKQKLLSKYRLCTEDNRQVFIQNTGYYNTNSGPDFLHAKIQIGETLWVGHVEIHVRSSDWYLHRHEMDANYDPVILHVVWINDSIVYSPDNKAIPTLVVQKFIDKDIVHHYQFFQHNLSWIPCENEIWKVDKFLLQHWLERLYIDRLKQKSTLILEWLKKENYDFEKVLFILLASNFGLKNNSETFIALANSFDFKLIQKLNSDVFATEALLFGQAGFLEEFSTVDYQHELKREYEYLKHKYHLSGPISMKFNFFRMRPSNFPTIRIAQFASLYATNQTIFSALIHSEDVKTLQEILKVSVSDFWKSHFSFESKSPYSEKSLSLNFVHLIIINCVLPLKLNYLVYQGKPFEDEILGIIQHLPPEKNTIIKNFIGLGVTCENALESQGFLELKNNYCAKKRCLQCAIGVKLLKE